MNGKTEKRINDYIALGTLASVGILLIVLAIWLKWPGTILKVDVTTVSAILAPLMLTALFIERAVEVVISPWRDPGADQKARALKDAKNNSAAIASQQAAADDYTQYKGQTRRYAFVVALLLGTAAATVGIRALWPFIDDPNGIFVAATASTANGITTVTKAQGNPINDPHNNNLRNAFIVVDIALSSLLLAGGANGIHSVVTAFTNFFDKNTQQSQGTTS
jgi:hypothetical protein